MHALLDITTITAVDTTDKKHTGLVHLDITTAFKSIYHLILFYKLEHSRIGRIIFLILIY